MSRSAYKRVRLRAPILARLASEIILTVWKIVLTTLARTVKSKAKPRSDILLFALAVVFVCAAALWFFWPEISWRLGGDEKKAAPERAKGPAKEKIFEEDRRKLDELLKQRQSK